MFLYNPRYFFPSAQDFDFIEDVKEFSTLVDSDNSSILRHAGAVKNVVIKQMYIIFNDQEFSIELYRTNSEGLIMSLAAVKALIMMKLIPDE